MNTLIYRQILSKKINQIPANIKLFSSQSGDILQTINNEDLPGLKQMYKQNLPKLIEPYLFIDNYMQWKHKKPDTKIEFLCPDGKWDDGTFVAIAKKGIHNVYFHTLDKSCERLSNSLRDTRKINWENGPIIYSVHEQFRNKINPILQKINQPKRVVCDIFIWYLPKEEALKYKNRCPSDCYLGEIELHHVEELNKTWTMSGPGTEEYLKNIIQMNTGVGLFSKSNHELRSSVLLTDMGNLGVIQTPTKFRKLGYGKIVMEDLAKKRAINRDVTGYTLQDNVAMNALLSSMGFKIMYTSTLWYFVRSK